MIIERRWGLCVLPLCLWLTRDPVTRILSLHLRGAACEIACGAPRSDAHFSGRSWSVGFWFTCLRSESSFRREVMLGNAWGLWTSGRSSKSMWAHGVLLSLNPKASGAGVCRRLGGRHGASMSNCAHAITTSLLVIARLRNSPSLSPLASLSHAAPEFHARNWIVTIVKCWARLHWNCLQNLWPTGRVSWEEHEYGILCNVVRVWGEIVYQARTRGENNSREVQRYCIYGVASTGRERGTIHRPRLRQKLSQVSEQTTAYHPLLILVESMKQVTSLFEFGTVGHLPPHGRRAPKWRSMT
jgi:hypothetical protein